MMVKIAREQLDQFLATLSRDYDIYGPVQRDTEKGNLIWWDRVERLDELCLDVLPKSSLKHFLFPQPEVLLKFTLSKEGYKVSSPDPRRQRILFGVRPCDARSICLNQMPYRDDPYFLGNWSHTLIIGISCEEQCPTCFCTEVGGSPQGTEGMDARMNAHGDSWRIEVFTERGKELLSPLIGEMAAGEDPVPSEEARPKSGTLSLLKDTDLPALYDADIWPELAQACLNCGICTFLCPTCYCFDIQDERTGSRGRRIRYWDSCMFPLFTQHASGHNPRGTKIHRLRNRFLHKLKYFPDRVGPFSCVGCGRCIKECPVGIDIREILRKLTAIARREEE